MNKTLQDNVWSILPKEFKEEVKEEYFACKHCSAEASAMELEIIFGIHNLTSDADGEEMLTVPRKAIIQAYAKSCAKRATKYDAGYADCLYYLFGSKCLPDEEEKMTEERYQYLNSLSLEDYDNETSADEQRQFCEYQHKHHPDEVIYFQTHSDQEPNPAEPKEEAAEHFDTIVKGGFRNERRLNIAAQITASIYANDKAASRFDSIDALVMKALDIADTLIAECEKGGNHD